MDTVGGTPKEPVMAFRPRHQDHAIVDVVFAINLAREVPPPVMKTIGELKAEWTNELPISEEIQGHEVFVGPPPSGVSTHRTMVAGHSFKAVKRDGSTEWMVRFLGRLVTVNCGSYTRWNNVWPIARSFLQRACQKVVVGNNSISSIGLQYIDEFVWEGDPKSYSISGLIREGSEFPSALRDKGPLWHLHQGWFESNVEKLRIKGRRLEKLHIDAVERKGQYVTRVDTTLRHDLSDKITDVTRNFDEILDPVFDAMHERNKQLIRSFLTDEMQRRIKLDAPRS